MGAVQQSHVQFSKFQTHKKLLTGYIFSWLQ